MPNSPNTPAKPHAIMRRFLRYALSALPSHLQDQIVHHLSHLPVLNTHPLLASRRWVREEYTHFSRLEKKRLFLSIARFAHINRPLTGYYMEFGCHEANTMRLAWDTFRHLFDWDYVALDSFAGLPDMPDDERSSIFWRGNLSTSEDEFIRLVVGHGMPRKKLTTIKGYYNQSLTRAVQDHLLPSKAAVIYIDCDLYSSAADVLSFIPPFLQKGTIIVFDDWNCYLADPSKGERRAWTEFIAENPDLHFEDFVQNAEAKSFVCTRDRIA